MATKQFMKIGNIKGNSTEANHKDWAEITEVSLGVGNPVNAVQAAKGKSSGGASTHADINVKMEIDKTLPEMMAYCSVGKCWDKAEFEICEEGEKTPLLRVELGEKVAITSCSVEADAAGTPRVNLRIGFAKITWKYKQDKDLYWDLKKKEGSLKAK